jgi:pumilio RNA-binding family
MEMSRDELRAELVQEILPSAQRLMTDTFGNYVIQNFLEHAPKSARAKIADAMRGSMVALSMHSHGCRVVQRALDLVEIQQRNVLLEELLVRGRTWW